MMTQLQKAKVLTLFEQLQQIVSGFLRQQPVWDGNLICKTSTQKLVKMGYVEKFKGYNFPTEAGEKLSQNFLLW